MFKGHIHLLPSYDEYLLGYKDRTDVLPKEHYPKAFTNNGLFWGFYKIKKRLNSKLL
jgi:hypothetical protein